VSDALYQALIVEHDRVPRHQGPLPGATHAATIDNPLCGDVVTLRLIVHSERVASAAFEARGCALSRAAASMLTERVIGRPIAELAPLVAEFERFVSAPPDDAVPAELGDLAAFAGVRRARSRRVCATLPFRALVAALS